ncbi:MAG: hypothetical protein ACQETE_10055 [Bacteroidota bacterium]
MSTHVARASLPVSTESAMELFKADRLVVLDSVLLGAYLPDSIGDLGAHPPSESPSGHVWRQTNTSHEGDDPCWMPETEAPRMM